MNTIRRTSRYFPPYFHRISQHMTIKRAEEKTGRNSPCPCGSGKKYKKCCLGGAPRFRSVPPTDEEGRLNELIVGGRDERVRAMLEVVQVVYARSRQNRDWNPADDFGNVARVDASRIELTLNEIATRAAEVLQSCPHSRQYWFQLLRRLSPLLWEELQSISKSEGSPDWFAEVVKGASHLVLSCSSDGEPWEWVDEGGVRGIDYRGLSRREMLVAAQIFSLAQLRYEAQVRFRFACKGFRVFTEGDEGDALAIQDTESIKRYEERRSRYETFTGSAGLWHDPEGIVALRKDLCLWVGLQTNIPDYFVLRSGNPAVEVPLQYLLLPFSDVRGSLHGRTLPVNESDAASALIPYDRLIEHPDLRTAFESAFRVESEYLSSFLYSIFRLIYTFLRFPRLDNGEDRVIEVVWVDEPVSLRETVLGHWQDVGVMGLMRSDRADWVERIQLESALVHATYGGVPALERAQVEQLIDRFTWRAGKTFDGSTPVLFIELSSHTTILDGFHAGDFLRHVLLAANVVSKDISSPMYGQDLTGSWLETQAAAYFTRELGLPPGKVIRGRVVRKTREIDIAFVFNRTLFVIDCKAMAKDAAFMEGQHRRIRNRHSEMRKELNEKNSQRINLVMQGLVKDAITPESFDSAYGLVCTSAVEYLPLEDDAFWSNGVPLVGPPEELLDTIRTLSIPEA
jgi:hypothetical protein